MTEIERVAETARQAGLEVRVVQEFSRVRARAANGDHFYADAGPSGDVVSAGFHYAASASFRTSESEGLPARLVRWVERHREPVA